jgi:STE24 endopeptidase
MTVNTPSTETATANADLEPAAPEVKQYSHLKHRAAFASIGIGIAFVLVAALYVGPRLEPLLQHLVGESRWLRLIAVAAIYGVALEVLTLPLDFWSGYVLEHRYQLSNQTFAGWVWKRIKGYLLGGPIALGLLLGLYALLWFSGDWWWVYAALGLLLFTVVMGRIAPVLIVPLFYKVTPLDNADLLGRLRHLAAGTGLTIEGVYRLGLSAETKKANAALAGLGRTRRVLLGDTLLDEFSPEEIEVVFAHELGHHVYRHIVKMMALSVVLTAGGLWLVDVILRHAAPGLGYTGLADPAALPLLLLVLTVFGLLLAPAQNALSRFFERQCDQYALDRTGKPEAYRSAFTRLARMNKSDPDPNRFVVWLLYDHPPIRERLAMAKPTESLPWA